MMTTLWLAVVLLCLVMYVVLDGYDLGIGVATLFERDDDRRRSMLELVAVAWDGNETWLVLLGVGLWAGFPVAFGALLPHAYLPLTVMLLALAIRGVAVEMVSQRPPGHGWVRAFGVASLVAAFALGFTLGTLAVPIVLVNGIPAGGPAAFTWFSVLTGLVFTVGCTALGFGHLVHKLSGEHRRTAARGGLAASVLAAALFVAVLAASGVTEAPLDLATPGRVAAFVGLLAFVAGGAIAAMVGFARAPRHDRPDRLPTMALAVSVVAAFLSLVAAHYPYFAPGLTVQAAVGPHNTLVFLLIGIGLNIPLVLGYNVFAHLAFRGRARERADAEVTEERTVA